MATTKSTAKTTKTTTAKKATAAKSTRSAPATRAKAAVKAENNGKKKILFVASECQPFVVTGGLAEVVGSLSKALAAMEVTGLPS